MSAILRISNKSSNGIVNMLITICAIFVLFGFFAIYANVTLKRARETALRNELINLRMSLEHYRMIKGHFPVDLIQLRKEYLTYNGGDDILIQNKFSDLFKINKKGEMVDPFLNKYGYDSASGKIWSNTKDYLDW